MPSEPRYARRIVSELMLEASDAPYVLMPSTYTHGQESPFTLVVRSDDCDDDGLPDFTFEPVLPKNDWKCASHEGAWADLLQLAQRAPQIRLHVNVSGRFFIFVDQIGLSSDGRAEEGVQQDPTFPAIGLALGTEGDPFSPLSESVGYVAPLPRDAAVFECRLDASDTPYVVVPFLEDLDGALARHPQLRFRVVIYSDVECALGDRWPAPSARHCARLRCCHVHRPP